MHDFNSSTHPVADATWVKAIAVTAAALMGIFLVIGVGIADADLLHNAAHDVRHTLAFPCH